MVIFIHKLCSRDDGGYAHGFNIDMMQAGRFNNEKQSYFINCCIG